MVDGHLGWFHSVFPVNSVAMSMGVQTPILYTDLHSFGYMSRSGIGGSEGVLFLVF
jgi:hypothetical protein